MHIWKTVRNISKIYKANKSYLTYMHDRFTIKQTKTFHGAILLCFHCAFLSTGVAVGIPALCITVEIQQRFNERRVIAFVILLSTANVGMIACSYAMGFLIEMFGWRGTMFINAAIMLHTIVSSLLLKVASGKQPKKQLPPSATEATEKKTSVPVTVPTESRRHFIVDMCRNADFILFSLARLLAAIATSSSLAHMPLRSVNNGMTLVEAMEIVAFVNIVFLLSRVITIITNIWHVANDILVTAVCILLSGAALLLSCLSSKYIIWIISYLTFGLLWGKFNTVG